MDKIKLENKLSALKIQGALVDIKENDFYIDYVIKFDDSIPYNKIIARQNDINILFNDTITIQPFNDLVLFRQPQKERKKIYFSNYQNDIVDFDGLPVFVGIDENNKPIIDDLRKFPHLLVAGSTGSGKSVFLNTCILSLILSKKSELVLIDLKQVEFSIYDNIPCLACPVVNDIQQASVTLKKLCDIMDKRYKLMKNYNCRDFSEYQEIDPTQNYITVIIDELADILLQNRKIIEPYLIRLAQKARACGIYLILATQRPSADIITGLLKDNMPTKICFSVPSSVASRIILDTKGGENLKRNGDGLYKPIGQDKPIHFQAPFISTQNILQFVETLKSK